MRKNKEYSRANKPVVFGTRYFHITNQEAGPIRRQDYARDHSILQQLYVYVRNFERHFGF